MKMKKGRHNKQNFDKNVDGKHRKQQSIDDLCSWAV